MMEFKHIPVMLDECIDGLQIRPDGIYLDGTLGGGGHSLQIAKRLTSGKLIAFDKDEQAIEAAKKKLALYADNIEYVHDDFKNAPAHLDRLGIDRLDGVLLDLGVSSYQLDNAARGFSYQQDAPLDMRMDTSQALTAKQVVNEYDEKQLADVIYRYGEDRLSRRIAANIVRYRAAEPIITTGQLADIVEKSYPAALRWKGGNPCKRTFQAIRIEVNAELSELDAAVLELSKRLKVGGRICIITFHSLEDRIVKTTFAELEKSCICPPRQPVCTCNKRQEIKIINKKPITASGRELTHNTRSQSAKLRIAERV